MFLICISEGIGSDLGWDTVYPEFSRGLPRAFYIMLLSKAQFVVFPNDFALFGRPIGTSCNLRNGGTQLITFKNRRPQLYSSKALQHIGFTQAPPRGGWLYCAPKLCLI
jgi:hypothetical protein